MAVSYVGTAVVDFYDFAASTGTTTFDPPTGISEGDLIIMSVSGDVNNPGVLIAPTGNYTAVDSQFKYPSQYPSGRSYWKNAGASESAQEFSTGTDTHWLVNCVAYAFRGHDSASPIGNTALATDAGNNTTSTIGPAGVTVQANGSMVVAHAICATANAGSAASSPTDMTEVGERLGGFNSISVARDAADSGSWTSSQTFSFTSDTNSQNLAVRTFEIKPAADTAIPPHTRKFGPGADLIFHNPR